MCVSTVGIYLLNIFQVCVGGSVGGLVNRVGTSLCAILISSLSLLLSFW